MPQTKIQKNQHFILQTQVDFAPKMDQRTEKTHPGCRLRLKIIFTLRRDQVGIEVFSATHRNN